MSDLNRPVPTVYVVDDEPMMRDALDSLLRSFGFRVRCFASTRDFHMSRCDPGPACLILDVRMPEEDGLAFQEQLIKSGNVLPIIFLTGHGDVPMAVKAMRLGAADFLLKPFEVDTLVQAINSCLANQNSSHLAASISLEEKKRFETLTARERKIVVFIIKGYLNKQIAAEFGLKEITIKIIRSKIIEKLGVSNSVSLAAFYQRVIR